jgi:hypothetical protein
VSLLSRRQLQQLKGKQTKEWTFWIDRACIDQECEEMKAHATQKFETYIKNTNALIVLLSPDYFTRLWCIFEYCSFIVHRNMQSIAIYTWAFMDRLEDTSAVTDTYMVNALASISVDKAKVGRDKLVKETRQAKLTCSALLKL